MKSSPKRFCGFSFNLRTLGPFSCSKNRAQSRLSSLELGNVDTYQIICQWKLASN
jgi:hypothetical protein